MTIKQLLCDTVARHEHAAAFRFKRAGQWHDLTYGGLYARVRRVSELLAQAGVKAEDRVALFMDNDPCWPEIYLGIVSAGATAVPVDARLKERAVAHLLRDSGARVVFVSARTYAVLRDGAEACLHGARVYVTGGADILPPARRSPYADYAEALDAVQNAASAPKSLFDTRDPRPETPASLLYTSGTTGTAKGVVLTHANFCANVEQCRAMIAVLPNDVFLLVLPLHHAFAFTASFLVPLSAGACTAFVENLKTVGENIQETAPTVMVGVPLLLEKMLHRIEAGLRGHPLAGPLYRLGLAGVLRGAVRRRLGGRLRAVVVGGAPVGARLMRRLARLGVPVLEGYGLTETAPVLTLNPPDAPRPGTVGKPLPGVRIRIVDPGEDGSGEIQAAGPNVTAGYWNDTAATAAAFEDAWFRTGDLGRFDADGYLMVTGRKKSLIVNREGKNIHPEEVEHAIQASPYVQEALVLGYREAGGGEKVGAIVVPDPDALDAVRRKRGGTLSDADADRLLRDAIRRATASLEDYKRPRRIRLRTEPLEKTATGKVKRYLYAMPEIVSDDP
jgi:long-chain acyl-CoA synthetase